MVFILWTVRRCLNWPSSMNFCSIMARALPVDLRRTIFRFAGATWKTQLEPAVRATARLRRNFPCSSLGFTGFSNKRNRGGRNAFNNLMKHVYGWQRKPSTRPADVVGLVMGGCCFSKKDPKFRHHTERSPLVVQSATSVSDEILEPPAVASRSPGLPPLKIGVREQDGSGLVCASENTVLQQVVKIHPHIDAGIQEYEIGQADNASSYPSMSPVEHILPPSLLVSSAVHDQEYLESCQDKMPRSANALKRHCSTDELLLATDGEVNNSNVADKEAKVLQIESVQQDSLDWAPFLSSNPELESSISVESVYDLSTLFSGNLLGNSKQGKRKKKQKAQDEEGSKCAKLRPNFFVASRITNPMIHGALKAVQDHIVAGDKKLKAALIPLVYLHVTFSVFHIDNEEDLKRAQKAMALACEKLSKEITEKPLCLQFQGLGHFQNKVVFAKVHNEDAIRRLQEIASVVREYLECSGVDPTDKTFEPHLTLLKLSRSPKLFRQGIRKIKPALYSAFEDSFFGLENLRSLQLLCMTKTNHDDGYYYCSAECVFGQNDEGSGGSVDFKCASENITTLDKELENKVQGTPSWVATTEHKNEIGQRIYALTKSRLDCLESQKQSVDKELSSGLEQKKEVSPN